jgi:hypothetical protein
MLHEADFEKYDRIAELANNCENTKSWSEQIKQIKEKIRISKS